MAKDAVGTIVDDFTDDAINAGGDAGGDNIGVSSTTDGDRINGYTTITPSVTGNDTGSGTGRRRGRPRGSRNAAGSRATPPKGNISALENILGSLHFFGAALLSTPEMELNDDETKKLAASMARVSSLYDDRINPKLVAWVDVLCVAGAIYGPRAIAISARLKTEKTTRPAPVPINVNRESRAATASKPTQAEPRSPLEMFGPEFSGAAIPDAV